MPTVAVEQREAISAAVRALATPDVDVRSVDFEEREDPDGRYLLIEVRLVPPKGDTWPLEAFYELRRGVREVVTRRLGEDQAFKISYVSAGGAASVEGTGAPVDPQGTPAGNRE
ncbi:hypothetical protein E9549_06375 [Blastococcus sp. MG754426]|uniref:hypothetical protein n=1 Tax=unclassified Blastococcus TaxID=2619396 RepID=UPI001EF00DFA|nr:MULTISPECIES: hypothetical protein [unclassified Blastococcus]MCF6507030.1 hypothetical protein [Blastococcus sp. MG754426]MCF6511695.1 hypothetical protein [Blastococcus sp. MG754427]